jgi:hypothetical protein
MLQAHQVSPTHGGDGADGEGEGRDHYVWKQYKGHTNNPDSGVWTKAMCVTK